MHEVVRVQNKDGSTLIGVNVYTFKIRHFYLNLCVYIMAFSFIAWILMIYPYVRFFWFTSVITFGIVLLIHEYTYKKLVLKVNKQTGELVQLIKDKEDLSLNVNTNLELIPLGVLSEEVQLLRVKGILYFVYRRGYAIDKNKKIDKEESMKVKEENKKAFLALEKAVNL